MYMYVTKTKTGGALKNCDVQTKKMQVQRIRIKKSLQINIKTKQKLFRNLSGKKLSFFAYQLDLRT